MFINRLRHVALVIAAVLVLSACGASGGAENSSGSDIGLSVSSGNFTTTVRTNRVTEVPFSETVIVEAAFENSIYGVAGQTSVFAQVSPSTYRIEARPRRNERTFTFAIRNRMPGTAEISVYENRDAQPVTFTLQIGEE